MQDCANLWMMVCLPRDKYYNKSRPAQIFHRYTGYIVFGAFVVIIASVWLWYDSEAVFFENWSCHDIAYMGTAELNENELKRYNEIISECPLIADP